MHKYLSLFLALSLIIATFIGCVQANGTARGNTITTGGEENHSKQQETADSEENPSKQQEATDSPEKSAKYMEDEVDIDLTVMSSTMIYAEVYNIMQKPEKYLGKTVKIEGAYYASYYNVTEKYYHFVIIEDATACCQSGLEIVWNGEHTYPDDYPEDETRVEVIGVFKSDVELGEMYYYLETDDIKILE